MLCLRWRYVILIPLNRGLLLNGSLLGSLRLFCLFLRFWLLLRLLHLWRLLRRQLHLAIDGLARRRWRRRRRRRLILPGELVPHFVHALRTALSGNLRRFPISRHYDHVADPDCPGLLALCARLEEADGDAEDHARCYHSIGLLVEHHQGVSELYAQGEAYILRELRQHRRTPRENRLPGAKENVLEGSLRRERRYDKFLDAEGQLVSLLLLTVGIHEDGPSNAC
mmetsp:Transcript_49387/g.107553  ORF Transcript_49387/g.107553 Transcript_49387/m.107553 type:complete len:225 (+) Transcript_49387:478-1152(+)